MKFDASLNHFLRVQHSSEGKPITASWSREEPDPLFSLGSKRFVIGRLDIGMRAPFFPSSTRVLGFGKVLSAAQIVSKGTAPCFVRSPFVQNFYVTLKNRDSL